MPWLQLMQKKLESIPTTESDTAFLCWDCEAARYIRRRRSKHLVVFIDLLTIGLLSMTGRRDEIVKLQHFGQSWGYPYFWSYPNYKLQHSVG